MATFLLQAVFLPIILAPLIYILGRRVGSKIGWATIIILFYGLLMLLSAAVSNNSYIESYDWHPIGTFGLLADGLSLPFAATIYILSAALAIYSIPYMSHRIEEEVENVPSNQRLTETNNKFALYNSLYLLYAAGMLGTVLATNLIQFYIFFELMLIPSYFLIAQFGYGERTKISFMYFIWTHLGALILLAGILTLGLLSGSFDMPVIFESLSNGMYISSNVLLWIGLAFTVRLFVKLAEFGVHVWLPHAHADAPTPISALLSPAMIGIGGYALIRFLVQLIPSAYLKIALALSIWGLITMIYGGLMALSQDDLKRLLAYSSVSQMGYIIFGIASSHYIGISGSVLHYVSHGTGKAILFMVAGSIILQTGGIRKISALGGLGSKLPLTAIAAALGFLTLIGVPPLNGFQAEWMLFSGAFSGAIASGSNLKLLIAIVALLSTPLTAGYTLWTMKRIFFGTTPNNLENVKEAPMTIIIPIFFLAFVGLLLGIYPTLITERLIPAVIGIIGG